MADPYATRAPDLGVKPSGPPPWLAVVEDRGGAIVGADGVITGEARFHVVHCRGVSALAPLARLDAPTATLLWLEHVATVREAAGANALCERLAEAEVPLLAIKHGCVAGPPGGAGCFEVGSGLVGTLIDAILLEKVGWERDPDFGYEVPARVAGLAGQEARALLPRLLYGDHDRVYEHAGLVASKQLERAELAGRVSGLVAEVERAAGRPDPTADRWR